MLDGTSIPKYLRTSQQQTGGMFKTYTKRQSRDATHPRAHVSMISAVEPGLTERRSTQRCFLLELPAEIREQIWIHTVTNRTRPQQGMLVKQPIRVDRLNRPLPPPITLVSRQLRDETLHLYYKHNVFECWRPFIWQADWSLSTLVYWLGSLGPEKLSWLDDVIFLYKNESELKYDIEGALSGIGFDLRPGVLSYQQELSEYEMRYEELGLPRNFGKKRHRKWFYSSG